MTRQPKVFISYARDDLPSAIEIYRFLLENNCNPWMDKYDIAPGQDWVLEIQNTINKADFFLACLSGRSVSKRGYVQKELKLALSVLDEMPEGEIYIIPLRLENCNVPYSLSARQWIDWFLLDERHRLIEVINPSTKSKRRAIHQKKKELTVKEIQTRRKKAERILTQQGISAIISMLDKTSKVDLLYLYNVVKKGWGHKEGKVLLYTDITYTVHGVEKIRRVDNYSDRKFYDLCCKYGLGDDKVWVRDIFIDALASLTEAERYKLFDGILVIDAIENISPD